VKSEQIGAGVRVNGGLEGDCAKKKKKKKKGKGRGGLIVYSRPGLGVLRGRVTPR